MFCGLKMDTVLNMLFVRGIGPYSSEAREKIRSVLERLRELGIRASLTEIELPVLDEEGLTPELVVDGELLSLFTCTETLLEAIVYKAYASVASKNSFANIAST